MSPLKLPLAQDSIASFCKCNHIRRLSLFGLVLRNDFRPDSNVDLLVVFDPDFVVGWCILEIGQELFALLGGHNVNIINENYLNPRLRERIVSSAEAHYAEG